MPGFGRMQPPAWRPDPEFDLDYHLRHITLPAPGTKRQLLDLATRLYQDPYDRTRPLWIFVVIDGLENGQGALFWKTHHSISDGIGLVRLSERYMERSAHAPLPPEVDLESMTAMAAVAEQARTKEQGGDLSAGLRTTAAKSLTHVWRRQIGISRRLLGEVALWPADPLRIRDRAESVVGEVQSALDQTRGGDVPGGSPIWTGRSRRRHLEALRVDLEGAKAAAKTLGGSVNDFFVAGAVMGALDYHAPARGRGGRAEHLLRREHPHGHGRWRKLVHPDPRPGARAGDAGRGTLRRDTRPDGGQARAGVKGAGAMSRIAGVANLLPTSVVTHVARAQAAKVDFATSNVRARRSRCTSPGVECWRTSSWVRWQAPRSTSPWCPTTGVSTWGSSSIRPPSTIPPASASTSRTRTVTFWKQVASWPTRHPRFVRHGGVRPSLSARQGTRHAVDQVPLPDRVTGLDNVCRTGPAIIAPNHISFFDSVALIGVLPRRITYVGKAEYLDSWKTRYVLPAMGMIPIERTGGKRSMEALDTAAGVLERGELFGIFPEGTRRATASCTRDGPGSPAWPCAAARPSSRSGSGVPTGSSRPAPRSRAPSYAARSTSVDRSI